MSEKQGKGGVLEFKPRKFVDVWQCACGCQEFYLLATMRVECQSCGSLQNSLYLSDSAAHEEIACLSKAATQRGARMQFMREALVRQDGWGALLEDYPDAEQWFDGQGVPL